MSLICRNAAVPLVFPVYFNKFPLEYLGYVLCIVAGLRTVGTLERQIVTIKGRRRRVNQTEQKPQQAAAEVSLRGVASSGNPSHPWLPLLYVCV